MAWDDHYLDVRVVVDHDPEQDYHEWITLGQRFKGNCNGVLNRRMHFASWAKWQCNNPRCGAWAVVSDAGVRRMIERAVTTSTGNG